MNRQERRQFGTKGGRGSQSTLNRLPLPTNYVNQVSLANHLALEACRVVDGNKDALNRISSVLYLGYLIWETDASSDDDTRFRDAEAVLDAAVQRAATSGIWRVEPRDCMALARLLLIHDEQLASVSTRAYLMAVERLDRLLLGDDPVSPLRAIAKERTGAGWQAAPCDT